MIFGAVKRLPAVDAAPLHQLNMILVLGLNSSLLLFTGLTKYVQITYGSRFLGHVETWIEFTIYSVQRPPFQTKTTKIPLKKKFICIKISLLGILKLREKPTRPLKRV
jgi:hypothetical protein